MAKVNDVQVIQKDTGEKIQWEQNGQRLSFDDEALTVKVPKYQGDEARTLDVCRDRTGDLMLGVQPSGRYVAQIEIPAAEYDEVTTGEGEEATTTRTRKELDMAAVKLILWSVE